MAVLEKFSLAGKAVLITGATGHLGQAMAWAVGEAGGQVLVNARSYDNCERLVANLSQAGFRATNASFDVRDEAAMSAFFSSRKEDPLHCLINNAYAGGSGTIETASPSDYLGAYESSVVAAHNLLRNALPGLRRAVEICGDASVINVGSMYGLVSPDQKIYASPESANPPFYGAAKAALLQWTRYAACELGREGIRVNSISPGPFPAPSVRAEFPEFVEHLAKKVPLGRVGNGSEIQGAAVLLASAAATFINGTNLVVDGGWTSW